jgi:hypothetical protein
VVWFAVTVVRSGEVEVVSVLGSSVPVIVARVVGSGYGGVVW